METGKLLGQLFTRLGIDTTNAIYAPVLGITTDINDTDAKKVLGELFTYNEATTSAPAIAAHYKKQVFDTFDDNAKILGEEQKLDSTDQAELIAERNSFEKYKKLISKIDKKYQALLTAKGGDKETLLREIEGLKTKVTELVEFNKTETQKIRSEAAQELEDSFLRSYVGTKNFVHKDIDRDVNIETTMTVLRRSFAEQGIKLVRNPDTKKYELRQASDDKQGWLTSTNEKKTVEQYIDGLLTEKKMVVVNGLGKGETEGEVKPDVTRNDNNGKTGLQINNADWNSSLDKGITEAMKEYQNG